MDIVEKYIKPFGQDLIARLTNIKNFMGQSLEGKAYTALVVIFLIAILPFLPYTFYITLRAVAVIVFGLFIMALREKGFRLPNVHIIALIGLIILYNPLFTIHLGQQILWTFVNLSTLFYLYIVMKKLKPSTPAAAPEADNNETGL